MSQCLGKIRFPNQAAAEQGLASVRVEHDGGGYRATQRREKRTYQCPICDGWHLTKHARPREVRA